MTRKAPLRPYALSLTMEQAEFLLELVDDDMSLTDLTVEEKAWATSIQHRLRDIVTPEWRPEVRARLMEEA